MMFLVKQGAEARCTQQKGSLEAWTGIMEGEYEKCDGT